MGIIYIYLYFVRGHRWPGGQQLTFDWHMQIRIERYFGLRWHYHVDRFSEWIASAQFDANGSISGNKIVFIFVV